jgi:hypothetical protein
MYKSDNTILGKKNLPWRINFFFDKMAGATQDAKEYKSMFCNRFSEP